MNAYSPETTVWWDGKLQNWGDSRLHLLSKGLQYSVSAFEGIRAYNCAEDLNIFRLEDHLRRLRRSGQILGFDLPYSDLELLSACHQIASAIGECYLRPTAFLKEGSPGLHGVADVEIAIAGWPWPNKRADTGAGLKLTLSRFRRVFSAPELAWAKASANYMPARLALQEARNGGFDDAILLDEQGLISEATTSNLFIVKHGSVVTPKLGSALQGITRATAIELLERSGEEVFECDLTPDDLRAAEEIILTGTAAEIGAVDRCDGVNFAGRAGRITALLTASYESAVRTPGAEWKAISWGPFE